jgi:hypothetical protein
VTTPPLDPDQPQDAEPVSDVSPQGNALAASADAAAFADAAPTEGQGDSVPAEVWATPVPQTVVPGAAAGSGKGSRRGWIIGGVVAVAVLILAAGGFAAYGFISGGGAQPEDVIPAEAVAFVKIDLDPAAGQKVALARLATRFDLGDAAASAEDQDPSQILSDVLSQATDVEVDYARDIEPWVGSRAAVAVIAPEGGDLDAAKPLVVIASTDDEAAQASLQRLFPASSGYGVAVRDGFALVGAPGDVEAPAQSLSQVSAFTQAEEAIGDNVVLGYVDIDGIVDAAEKAGEDLSDVPLPEVGSPIGRRAVSFGLVAEPDAISVRGHLYGLTEASSTTTAPLALNEGAVALLGIRGLEDTVSKALEAAGADAGVASLIDVEQFAAALGDLTEVQVAVSDDGEPALQGTVVTSDVSATEEFWQSLGSLGGLSVTSSGNVVTIAEPDAASAFGPLGDGAAVTSVLPNADTANLVLWADINALEASGADVDLDEQARELKAVGLTVSTATTGDAEILAVAQFD